MNTYPFTLSVSFLFLLTGSITFQLNTGAKKQLLDYPRLI